MVTVQQSADEDTDLRPLAGMRIIELSSYIASPLGGMILAQLGADVIRVDPIGGAPDRWRWPLAPSGESLYWAELNRGKRSVTVDLRSEEGRALVAHLVAASGPFGPIVLTNAHPRPGLGYDDLRVARPDVIFVQLLGRRDGRTAVDYIVNAALGFPMITGPEDHGGPINHALPVWDVACGLYLAVGLLAADRQRHLTGRGRLVTVALEDVALSIAGNLGYVAEAQLSATPRPRIGNSVYGTFGHDFATADGRRVMVVALTTSHWRDLLSATGCEKVVDDLEHGLGADFSDEGKRYQHRDVLAGLLAPWFASRTCAELTTELKGRSFLWSVYRRFTDVVHQPDGAFQRNPMVHTMDHAGIGPYNAVGSPLLIDGQQELPASTPRLGEHTDDVLRDVLSLTPEDVDDLRRRRIVGES